MFFKHLELTSALRPSLLSGEVLLFTQDSVGLYENKYKIAKYQNGQIYLTSHRICYIDNQDPRKNCIAIDLKDVERHEFYGGYLKSSPKITVVLRSGKPLSYHNQATSLSNDTSNNSIFHSSCRVDSITYNSVSDSKSLTRATWICPICSFSNLIPSDFDPATANERTVIIPCSTCGVKPPWVVVFKAAISNANPINLLHSSLPKRSNTESIFCNESNLDTKSVESSKEHKQYIANSFQCPRCTFLNHPSLMACELCNAPLICQEISSLTQRIESPGSLVEPIYHQSTISIGISFRGGGEKIFHERLKGSMIQRKWLLHGAPPVPTASTTSIDNDSFFSSTDLELAKTGGIACLEARRLQERQKNERVIGSAFEDLDALMSSAQEIIALAESFASNNGNLNSDSNAVANALGLVTTKEMLGSNSESLYITELTRNMTEFLMDDVRGVLSKAGGIISLIDLWAKFNRARGGVELVSPNDFAKAAHQWEKLKLPFRLRKFKSGVLVVQGNEHTDQKINASIKTWLKDLHTLPPEQEVAWNWQTFGCSITAEDVAEKFGWSIGVAEEELEMVEEQGTICREDGIEGTRFWYNHLTT